MVSDEEAAQLLVEAKDIANCDPEEYYRDFLLVRGSEEGYEAKKVDFHSSIQTELNINLTEQIQSLIADIGIGDDDDEEDSARKLLPYSVENHHRSPTPVQYLPDYDVLQLGRYRDILNDVTLSETTDFSEVDDVQFQSFRVKNNFMPELVAFGEFTSRQIVGSSFRVKVTTRGNQEYNTLKENPVALPDQFDAIYYDGVFFVFNPTKFEKIFDHFEIYENDATDVFNYIEESDLNISQFDKLKSTVRGNNSSLRMMREIKERGKYQSLTRDRAEKLITEWDLDIQTGRNEHGEWEIQIPDLRKVHQVLGLLNDDMVVSGLDIVSGVEDQDKYFSRGGKETRS